MLGDFRAIGAQSRVMAPNAGGGVEAGTPARADDSALEIDELDSDLIGALRVRSRNLTDAWVTAVSALTRSGVGSLAPLVVTVTGFDGDGRPEERPGAVAAIDVALRAARGRADASDERPLSIGSTASTIFPEALWNPARPRRELFERYTAILPTLRRIPANRRGIYFERLIAYGRGPEGGNQLEFMLQAFERGVNRTSVYQAPITDPERDATMTPLLGFPCMQQIALHPSRTLGTLAITGFYGTQYVFDRAYGNYVGLCRLGRFMAHEMGLRLTRMTCVASYAKLGTTSKRNAHALALAVRGADPSKD